MQQSTNTEGTVKKMQRASSKWKEHETWHNTKMYRCMANKPEASVDALQTKGDQKHRTNADYQGAGQRTGEDNQDGPEAASARRCANKASITRRTDTSSASWERLAQLQTSNQGSSDTQRENGTKAPLGGLTGGSQRNGGRCWLDSGANLQSC